LFAETVRPGRVRQTLSGWEWECSYVQCGSSGRYFGSEFCAANLLATHELRSHGTEVSRALIPAPPIFTEWTGTSYIREQLSKVWGDEFRSLPRALQRRVTLDAQHMINTELWGLVPDALREYRRRILPGTLARYADSITAP
jgi:hypothetical protein